MMPPIACPPGKDPRLHDADLALCPDPIDYAMLEERFVLPY